MQFAAYALARQCRDSSQPIRQAAEELRDPVRTAQIQMRVVFKRDPDAAEHLNAVLGVGLRRFDRGRRRDRRGDRELSLIGIGHGGGSVTRGYRNLLRPQQHLGAHVLDGLEAADRLTELLAHLRVLGGGPQCPAGQPRGLGGEHGRGEIPDPLGRYGQHLGGCGVQQHPRQRAREVGGLQRFDGHTVGGRVDEQNHVGRGQQQHPLRIGTEHVFGTSGGPTRVVPHVGRCGDTRGALPRCQRVEQLGMGCTEDQCRQRRGGDRAGDHRRGGFVDHRAQVIDGATGTTVLLGKRDAEDP